MITVRAHRKSFVERVQLHDITDMQGITLIDPFFYWLNILYFDVSAPTHQIVYL